jgi:hypothetical protein
MSSKQISDDQRIITPEFRVSHPHLFKPNAVRGGAPKYSVTMLFPKNIDVGAIQKAIVAAKVSQFGPNKDAWPKKIASPVRNGDDPDFADKEGYAGHWVIKAISSEDQKPGLVDQKAQPILEQSKFYPGCYARAQIFARVYEFENKYGVHFIVDHVQKTRDGKTFSKRKSAEEVFAPIDGGGDGNFGDEVESQDFT